MIVFKATPTATGDDVNPRPKGVAKVDPDGLVAEDYTNNTATDTVTVTSARYVTFTCDQNISDANAKNVILTGTGIHDGDTITVSVHDADGPPYDYSGAGPVTVSDGTWFVPNLDASGLADGWIYWSITEKNAAGTVIGGLSAWPSVKGPPLAFTTAPDINASNVKNITVSGTEAITADPYYADPINTITDGTVTSPGQQRCRHGERALHPPPTPTVPGRSAVWTHLRFWTAGSRISCTSIRRMRAC